MKKSAILALALVFVGGVLFVAWRALRSETAPALERDVGRPGASSSKPQELERIDDSGRASSARLAGGHGSSRAADSGVPATSLRALRVHVSFSSGLDEHPNGLDVRISNRTGAHNNLHQVGVNEFQLGEILPGPYVVAVTAENFKPTIARVDVSSKAKETSLDVVLHPARNVVVRWQTREGKPIQDVLTQSEFDAERVRLAVHASLAPILEDGPEPERCALTSIRHDYEVGTDDEGHRFVRSLIGDGISPLRPMRNPSFHRALLASGDPALTANLFDVMTLDEPGPLWVSAWCGGVLIDTQPLEAKQSEVVFTTAAADLATPPALISLWVIDTTTEMPIEGATVTSEDRLVALTPAELEDFAEHGGRLTTGGSPKRDAIERPTEAGAPAAGAGSAGARTDAFGRVVFKTRPGWKKLRIAAEGHADSTVRIHARAGAALDLGILELSSDAGLLKFMVLDAQGLVVSGSSFELVLLSSYDGTARPFTIHQQWSSGSSDQAGLLVFEHVAPAQYVLRCVDVHMDATPLLVEPSAITSDRSRITGVVTVTTEKLVSFVFTPPLPQGTLLMLETTDGLPVSTLETNEFGVVATWLGGTEYSLHLVEAGRATAAIRFTVATDPFVLEIDH